MAADPSNFRPVQVLLNTKQFIDLAEPREFGGGTRDFFAGNDRGFVEHKKKFSRWLQNSRVALEQRRMEIGFLRVQMDDAALGKTYRPINRLFTKRNGFPLVGAGALGEMIFQASPQSLARLDELVEARAEEATKFVENKDTGVLEPKISVYRSEVGAVSGIELHDAADRVSFTGEEAVAWLSQDGVIGGYIIELFKPHAIGDQDVFAPQIDLLTATLARLDCGIVVAPFGSRAPDSRYGERSFAISARLTEDRSIKSIELPSYQNEQGDRGGTPITRRPAATITPLLDAGTHQAFLNALAEQSLVRSVELPPLVEAAPAGQPHDLLPPVIPMPAAPGDLPVVGIIDGGVAKLPELAVWCAGEAELVPAEHRDENHGTFIAGLIVAGTSLNPAMRGLLEEEGCRYFDLDIFPRRDLRSQYFGGDADYFFDLLEEKIKAAKRECNVRIFNLSFGLKSAGSRFGYSVVADRLDRLARTNDVIFVVSAGNLSQLESRQPWSAKAEEAIAMLAATAGGNQQIVSPAEQLLGLTIGAVNPPGIRGHEGHLPTTYTRRGPGVGGSRKPDLAHYGGAQSGTTSGNRTGLTSLSPQGNSVESCGTSFAAPNAAKTLAILDHQLAHSQPREVMLAMPIHRAIRGNALSHSSLRHIAREFVGFGIPPQSSVILADSEASITLIFSETLHRRRVLEFPFSWPASLVADDGRCTGRADVTLVFTPPIDAAYKDEALRVLLDAHLYQETIDPETGETGWESQLVQDGSGVPQGANKTEKYMLRAGLKWSPIKRYFVNMPKGRGNSSNWKLTLNSLTRAGADYPAEGVPFAVIMTLSDPKGGRPIHDSIRNSLQARGVNLADITVAHRVRTQG